MESTQILAQVDTTTGDIPHSWLVFPLLRQKVIIGILGWLLGAILGGLLFGFMAPIMIPHNYQAGLGSALVSTVVLGIVLYVCLGSVWALVVDVIRVRNYKQHLIVITPDDFVKQEGKKIIHVPLEYVRHVTARGAPPVDRSLATAREDGKSGTQNENMSSLIFGRRVAESGRKGLLGRKRMRTPTTLAFIDDRTGKEVVVLTDKAHGDPYYIAAYLKEYAKSAANKPVTK